MIRSVLGIVITVLTAIPVLLQLQEPPRGLFILFFAEMWERFSYYGMRGLLVYFLTQHFLFDDPLRPGPVRGLHHPGLSALPLVGGVLADRWLGHAQGHRLSRRNAARGRPLHHGH